MILAVIAIATTSIGDLQAADDVDMRCGAYCLYISLKALGLPAPSYDEVETKLGQPGPRGYSLGAIADVATQYGAHTLGVVTTADNLARRSRPFTCIARLGENHFVNIGYTTAGRATIVDPPRQYELPLDTLRTKWDGTALLLSTAPLAQEEDSAPRGWATIGAMGTLFVVLTGAGVLWFRKRGGAGL